MSALQPVALTPENLRKLDIYLDMLSAWNRVINLSGARDRRAAAALAQDSFYLAAFLSRFFAAGEDAEIWDLGAGAGLPGIPLRLAWPWGRCTLVEAREKRALFLANVLARLQLPATQVYRGRAEDFFASAGKQAACVISRAFMPWPELLPFCRPHLAPGGILIVMASRPAPALPGGWQLAASQEYEINAGRRCFWALRRLP